MLKFLKSGDKEEICKKPRPLGYKITTPQTACYEQSREEDGGITALNTRDKVCLECSVGGWGRTGRKQGRKDVRQVHEMKAKQRENPDKVMTANS